MDSREMTTGLRATPDMELARSLFDELAAQASNPGLRGSYATVAQSYRRLVEFMQRQPDQSR